MSGGNGKEPKPGTDPAGDDLEPKQPFPDKDRPE